MGLKPYDRSIKHVFNSIEYDVDFYQREYKWSDNLPYKPVTSILTDIYHPFDKDYKSNIDIRPENIQKFEWYYLNSFMTNTDGRKYIVDGQQRLTTLTLINLALYHLAEEFKLEDNIKDTLKNSVFGSNEYGTTFWVGFRDRQNAFKDILDNDTNYKYAPNNISERNMQDNYRIIKKFLAERLNQKHKLNTFILYYRERIFLIEIEVDKSKDVAMVFEVINDRGVPLKAYEILKGKLISQINKADNDEYISIWENSINKIEEYGEKEIDDFFFFFFRAKYCDTQEEFRSIDRISYHKTIFLDKFNSKLHLKEDEQNVKEFIKNDFTYYIFLYCEILKYYKDHYKDYEHVFFNKINDIDGQFVLILSSVALNDPSRSEKIKLISRLFDRLFVTLNLTGSYRSNDFNNLVVAISSQIRNKNVDEIKKVFDDTMLEYLRKNKERPTLDFSFRYEFFKDRNYTEFGSKYLRYFFARVDHFVSELSNIPPFGSYYQLVLQSRGEMVFHIEHILSNNSKNLQLFKTEDEFSTERNRLGAIVLLKGSDNESSGKELYKEKLKTYSVKGTRYAQTLLKGFYKSNSDFKKSIKKYNLSFTPYDTFGIKEIEERHKLLFEIVKHIWQL